jgi:hypothetical protein
MELLTRKDYTDPAWDIRPINPKYKKLVRDWGIYSRLVDYWVDQGYVADELDFKASLRLALRNEEKFFNEMLAVERDLPKRELVNARRQLKRFIGSQLWLTA